MTKKQIGVGVGMAAGAALMVAVLLCPDRWFGGVPGDLAERLGLAARASAIAMLWLVAAVGNVARGRFFSPVDIDGAGFAPPSARIAVDVAIVQNTLEQAVLASVLYFALAALGGEEAGLIWRLVLLFCAGRFGFWAGYRCGAPWRAFGFAATFYPIVYGYVVVGLRLFR
jgi:uncharacterized membrane protein YecN with MAPEG domain